MFNTKDNCEQGKFSMGGLKSCKQDKRAAFCL